MEQLESRALGKPKESVTVDGQESDAERALRELTPAQRMELWKARGLRAVDDEPEAPYGRDAMAASPPYVRRFSRFFRIVSRAQVRA
jgi:hypothetical protein